MHVVKTIQSVRMYSVVCTVSVLNNMRPVVVDCESSVQVKVISFCTKLQMSFRNYQQTQWKVTREVNGSSI